MSRNLFLVLFALLTLLHASQAKTRHVVGGSIGWTIPSGGAATYVAWAANQTFTVGDTLVFNFTTGQHDVAKVTKSAYDACNNSASTIFTILTGPATVPLNETGEQYYICTFGSHCSLGQKLAINVSRASTTRTPSPAPQPTPKASPSPSPSRKASSPTSPPAAAPAPGPSTGPVTIIVGGSIGWTVPTGGAANYTNWASGKTFKVGDTLVFNYPAGTHNVEEVTKEKFDSCDSSSPIATYTTPPVRLTLNKTGENYFICGFTGHCPGGQKLAINVTGTTSPSPPSSSTPSSLSPAGAPPQDSGAASIVGFSATLLSLAVAFFY